ncbi:hypothetical protein BEP19_13635 [Ammoniphilus oxalaticus]|uniref:Uncharacterized protein n=1 Tax=Ammoniphilus oxalaticus TaxID=66863 RepID=A0A419SEA7_9BACL|nr:PBP1A family penicillin-binding protein [Ammoniphilus oxalaticus]RKD21675.1 hypothetical protein BEP19_13635 [Ammoniphilus oxalaticus]
MRKKRKKNNWLRWFVGLAGLFTLLVLGGCAALMSVGNVIMDKDKVLQQSQTSVLLDINKNEFYKLYVDQNREYVEYPDIPPLVVKAFVNVEDERFFTHTGVDVIAIGRAIYKDIKARGAVEGASTITQQLAKNVYLTNEKSIWRKTKEAVIALNLERNYSKEQILEFYLNEILFGDAVYGIKAASEYYFGITDLNELSLAQVATLAGLPKAPNAYSPFNNYERSAERRKVVLSVMHRNGSITKEEMEQASAEELELNPNREKRGKPEYRAYVDYVIKEAQEKYNLTENDLYRGGYRIYTQLDPQAQRAMFNAFNNDKLFPRGSSKENKPQAAMVILDHKTGGVAAMMGRREYNTGDRNLATQAERSPGSTFKPVAVYTAALENGWGPYDTLKDEKMTFAGGYSPSNWAGDGYWGRVTMIDAVKRSKNVSAVWLLNELGIDTSFRYLDRFGFEYDKQKNRKLGIALGDFTPGVSAMDMAQAYSAFANRGVIIEPHAITRVEDNSGVVVANADISTSTVMSEQNAYYMTQMLKSAVDEGTGRSARMNRPVAGKTGTTQMEGTRGNRDAWFVGYTPEYVGSIWMGYERSSDGYLVDGSGVTAKFFSTVMSEALKGKKVKQFDKPSNVKELRKPIEVPSISDLKAQQIADSVHLTWSAQEEGMIYRIYRYFDDPGQTEFLGEVDYNEWVDLEVPSDRAIHYLVIPFSTKLDKEGAQSNTVKISPKEIDPSLLPPEEGDDELDEEESDEEDLTRPNPSQQDQERPRPGNSGRPNNSDSKPEPDAEPQVPPHTDGGTGSPDPGMLEAPAQQPTGDGRGRGNP